MLWRQKWLSLVSLNAEDLWCTSEFIHVFLSCSFFHVSRFQCLFVDHFYFLFFFLYPSSLSYSVFFLSAFCLSSKNFSQCISFFLFCLILSFLFLISHHSVFAFKPRGWLTLTFRFSRCLSFVIDLSFLYSVSFSLVFLKRPFFLPPFLLFPLLRSKCWRRIFF